PTHRPGARSARRRRWRFHYFAGQSVYAEAGKKRGSGVISSKNSVFILTLRVRSTMPTASHTPRGCDHRRPRPPAHAADKSTFSFRPGASAHLRSVASVGSAFLPFPIGTGRVQPFPCARPAGPGSVLWNPSATATNNRKRRIRAHLGRASLTG